MDGNGDSCLGFAGNEAEDIFARSFPLHKACRDGDAVYLSRLVAESPPEHLLIQDQFNGWTPIHWAAYFGKVECLNGLLQSGVHVNVKTSKFQQTPLHIAAFGGHANILHELLKSGADSSATDYLGESALHKAARVGNLDCIRSLARNGTALSAFNRNGQTAYDIAHDQNYKNCSQALFAAHQNQSFPSNGLSNGSSGSSMNGFNGHTNGLANHADRHANRKRTHDDISIPITKRARIEPGQCRADEPKSFRCCGSVLSPSSSRLLAESEMDTSVENPTPQSINPSVSLQKTKHLECVHHDRIQSRGFPQYEDEVFCTDIDLPYGFWSGSSTNENIYSYACNSN